MTRADTTDIAAFYKERGLRLTGARRIIAGVLIEATDHPDAAEVYRRATMLDPRISIATVYRTLNLLREKGLLERHTFGARPARFEPASQEHHGHLINTETGEVIEFRSDEIDRLQEKVARRYGFEIVSRTLDIYVRPAKPKSGRGTRLAHDSGE